MKKRLISLLIISTLTFSLIGCSNKNNSNENNTSATNVSNTNSNNENSADVSSLIEKLASETTDTDSKFLTIEDADTTITLGDKISIDGEGASVKNNTITISSAGIYAISGTISDGQIIVDCADTDKVQILLNGVNISNSTNSPFYVKNADKTIITLIENTTNIFTDATSYTYDDESNEEPNACIFSKDDLTIKGKGSLSINGNYNNGIQSKDDLKITGGNIKITAKNDAIKGKDSVTIKNTTLDITSDGDGIVSNNADENDKGFVALYNGSITINSNLDAIQSETVVYIKNVSLDLTTGGGSVNSSKSNKDWGNWNKNSSSTNTNTESAKAIKSSNNITINGGNLIIDSSDDSIHSNNTVDISESNIKISSGDDGIHADSTLTINSGSINISKSYEGLEAEIININGGDITILSDDDGINAAGGNDSSSINGRPGENPFSSSGSGELNINGGNITVDAVGDGLDANGSITMTGGTVYVNGPTNDGNGTLDYDNSFNLNGGTIIGAGSSGMAQAASDSSKQNSIMVYLTSKSANSEIKVTDEDGNTILSYSPTKNYSSAFISSPDLTSGKTYTVSVGDETISSVTISSIVSTITENGASTGMNPGGGMNPGSNKNPGGGMRRP